MEDFITSKDYYENEKTEIEKIMEYKIYDLKKENNAYKVILVKSGNEILIKCKKYYILLDNNDLSILTKVKFNSVNESYDFIINILEQNKAIIKEIKIKKTIKIILKMNITNIEKDIELNLFYKKIPNLINNDLFNNLKKEIKNLKEEKKLLPKIINNINNENLIIKPYKFIKDYQQNVSNPQNIQFSKILIGDSYSIYWIDNTFTVFKSINEILYLIYTNKSKSIISYNFIEEKKIAEIKNAHNDVITNFRHYQDKISKRDLLMSISADDNNIKIWNINNFDCLINIQNINAKGYLYSACFLNDNNQIFIITSNCNYLEPIKVFDLNGKKIKELDNSTDYIIGFIDVYYDNMICKNYIITGNDGYIKSYDFNLNKIYHKYLSNDNKNFIDSIIINKNEIVKMIESCCDGNIRIWDFHSGLLLKKIFINNIFLKGICLWNKDNLFVGTSDKEIKLIDLNKGIIINNLIGHNDMILTIKKIFHPKYGQSLISQGYDQKIILWINKN